MGVKAPCVADVLWCKCIGTPLHHPSMKRLHSWADLIWVVVYSHYSSDTDISHVVLYCQHLFCAEFLCCASLSLVCVHLNKKRIFQFTVACFMESEEMLSAVAFRRYCRIRLRSWFSSKEGGIITSTLRVLEEEKPKRATSCMKTEDGEVITSLWRRKCLKGNIMEKESSLSMHFFSCLPWHYKKKCGLNLAWGQIHMCIMSGNTGRCFFF